MKTKNERKIEIRVLPQHYQLSFDFDDEILDVVRALPRRRYLCDERVWLIPITALSRSSLAGRLEKVARLEFVDTPEHMGVSGKPEPTLPPLFVEQLVRRRYSKHTIRNYSQHLRRFLNWLGPDREIADEAILSYINHIMENTALSPSWQNMAVNAIRYYVVSVLGRKMPQAPVRPKREKRLPLVLAEEEVKELLRSLSNLKHRCIISLIYSAGLRVSEVVHLRIKDIDFDRSILQIRQSKGKKDRIVPLAQKIKKLITDYRAQYHPYAFLFEGSSGGPYSVRSIQAIFQRACTTIGLEKKASVHSLRHSYATHLLEKGTDLRIIQELLGYASSKTTEIYTHVSTKTIGAVHSPFDDLDV